MDKLEIAKEAVKIYFDENITAREAREKAENLFATYESKQIDSNKNDFNTILPLGMDLDNNQVYLEDTGVTLGDIEEVFKCR